MLVPLTASANDSSFGGEGADLAPLEETRVRMKSEDIALELRPDDMWHVEARYVFENPTGADVSLQVGFPERHCDPDDDCVGDGRFRGLRTEVNGEPVSMRVGRVGRQHRWAPELGRVFLFDVVFPARREVEIVHRYRMHRSGSVEAADEVFYVTRTGALWNGPIGHARFTIRTPKRPWRIVHPAGYALASVTETPIPRGGGMTEIVFEMRDWTPERDLAVYLMSAHQALERMQLPCPAPDALAHEVDRATDPSQVRAILRSHLGERTDDELAVCRNLPFAAHGYPFRTARFRELFYRAPTHQADPYGYLTAEQAREERRDPRAWIAVPFLPNERYDRGLLIAVERRYIGWIRDEQARRRAERASR